MSRSSVRLFFCFAVALIAAAIADLLVEGASNAGWFGPGVFTDHSNLDIVPAVLAGCTFGLLFVVARVRIILAKSKEALDSGVARLLPVTFAIQIVLLYAIETTEQVVVWGHTLGGTIWLGGPVLISLAVHVVTCAVVAVATVRAVRTAAVTAVRVIRIIRALTTLSLRAAAPIALRRRDVLTFGRNALAPRSLGERAPPLRFA